MLPPAASASKVRGQRHPAEAAKRCKAHSCSVEAQTVNLRALIGSWVHPPILRTDATISLDQHVRFNTRTRATVLEVIGQWLCHLRPMVRDCDSTIT